MIQTRFLPLIAAVFLPLLVSCSDDEWPVTGERVPAWREMAGDWIASGTGIGTIYMHLHDDGSFEVTMRGERRPEIWGTYTLTRTQITFRYTGGVVPDECSAPGTYRYWINGSHLRFRVIEDNCLARSTALELDWRRRVHTDRNYWEPD